MQCSSFILLSFVVFVQQFSCFTALDNKINNGIPNEVAYTILVDKSGGGNFTTVQSAIDSVPSSNSQWIRIQISAGIYSEKVTIPEDKPFIFLQGAGSLYTFIQFGDHAATDSSSTFTSRPDNVVASGITFKNTYNAPVDLSKVVAPAVAARIFGDKSAFYHCAFVGFQDTLWDASGRHYFYKCYIQGVIDFIFGAGQSIYEKCVIEVATLTHFPLVTYGYITAQARDSMSDTNGFVFKFCVFTGNIKAYLGRGYGAYSRVIIFKSEETDIIIPLGWDSWNSKITDMTYAEVNCFGEGSDASKRVPWLKKLTAKEVAAFVDMKYIDEEGWIPQLPIFYASQTLIHLRGCLLGLENGGHPNTCIEKFIKD